MTVSQSRHKLFARLRGEAPQRRPPWSRHEEEFTDTCTQCGKCLEVCPTGILIEGRARYPIVDFNRGECTFCGACGDICPADCYVPRAGRDPWTLKATIAKSCLELQGVACRTCQEACANSAIGFSPRLGGGSNPTLSRGACTGCGACVLSCPVKAITIEEPKEAAA